MDRTVRYMRHEFRFDPETCEAPLWAFLYDIPHLAACGIFPPRHLLNVKLKTGGGDSGMSPGASWEPFELSESEYAETVAKVLNPDRVVLKRYARFIDQHWTLDPTLDHYTDWLAWFSTACAKHRSAYHARLKAQ